MNSKNIKTKSISDLWYSVYSPHGEKVAVVKGVYMARSFAISMYGDCWVVSEYETGAVVDFGRSTTLHYGEDCSALQGSKRSEETFGK